MQGTDTQEARRGLAPTVAVLVASLLVAAVGVYELSGFGLQALDRRPHLFSDGLATGGVIVAAVAAGAAIGNLAWMLAARRRVERERARAQAPVGP
ncbi:MULTISPECIES: hypothetical protein [Streptomyces]|uniref:hypothetical protein n=1 Tax=Streptomyces TaxID=1883 RepID=UPI000B5C4FBD|nr:hypothetical protein [Streptomyces hyaluromycini]